jgi:phosphoribosylformimino-5-aminoimidazole carboxamide ribotide isomerase
MKVIPAIDLLGGQVVRLKKGDYNDVTIYEKNPINVAKKFAEVGFNHIHIVDLDGAKTGRFENLDVINDIKVKTGLSIQTGGGIRTFEHCEMLLKGGIDKIVCSSMAVKNEPDWIKALEIFGGEQCILGMDLLNGKMAYSGWLETMDEPVNAYLERMMEFGLSEVLCTDISRDGMLSGANVDLYTSMMEIYPNFKFIASGGVSGIDDLMQLSMRNVHAVVVGRAYLEGYITLEQMIELHDTTK